MHDPLPRWAPRIVLRRLTADDLPAFQRYRHEEGLGAYQGWQPQPDTEAAAFIAEMSAAELFAPGRWVQIAIALRDSDVLVGDIGLHVAADDAEAEIGFTLSAQVQGRGLATEAVAEVIALLFGATRVARVVCITDARNEPSIRLLERLGMQRTATASAIFRGEPCVEHTYVLARPGGA